MLQPNLFVDCHCQNGERWYETKELKELKSCHICRGKQKLVVSEGFIKYQIALLGRYIDYFWKILKHQLPLPASYYLNLAKKCDKCNGGFNWEKVNDKLYKKIHCSMCDSGIIAPRNKEIYDIIFKNYLNYKEYRNKWKDILRSKEYFKEEYKEYEFIRVEGYKWVCVRCANFLDGTENANDTCNGCANETGCSENESWFVPYIDRSMNWYDKYKYRYDIAFRDEARRKEKENDMSKV